MKREDKKQAKRDLILRAAQTEFENRRFDEVTLDGIAARAGVGKGTLYLYFKNKEDLFVQMAVSGVDEMAIRMKEIAEMDEEFYDRLFRFGREVGAFVENRSLIFRLMHQTGSETIREQFIKYHERLIRAARAFLQSGIDEGVLRNDLTVADLHCLLVGPLLFRFRLNEHNGDRIEVESILKLFWDAASAKKNG